MLVRPERQKPPVRRGRRLWWLLPISLALHLATLAVFLLSYQPPPSPEGLGEPAVSVVLGPNSEVSASRSPSPDAALGTPSAESAVPPPPAQVLGAQPTPDLAVRPPDASAPPQVAPSPAAPAPKAAIAPPPPPAPALPQVPPAPSPPASPPPPPVTASVPDLPVPPIPPAVVPPLPPVPMPPAPPPVQQALVEPPPLPTPVRPLVRPPAPPRPAEPRPTPRPAPQAARPPSEFPSPITPSLGGSLTNNPSPVRPRGPSREFAGPVKLGDPSTSYRPQYDLSGDNLGPGWERAFRDWVNRHKYYPKEAAEAGEEGTAAVTVVMGRDGKVKSVNLIERSGSAWLDLALQALFRSQKLPPLPDSFGQDDATIHMVMHYILIR